MHPHVKASLLWGVVGGLAFLVLLQGYRLVVGRLALALPATLGVALVVTVVTTGLAYALEGRLG